MQSTIKAIALDDEDLPLMILKKYCQTIPSVELVAVFNKVGPAMDYLSKESVDLLFLDIQMPAMSGIEFYKKYGEGRMVIFTTAHKEFAFEGFDLSAVDYLVKPIDPERFKKAVLKATDYHNLLKNPTKPVPGYIFIKADYKVTKVAMEDIIYVEGLADYLRIYMVDGKQLVARMTMKGILDLLSADFMRIHRSFIVSRSAISSVGNRSVQLGGRTIPVGSTYWKEFENGFPG